MNSKTYSLVAGLLFALVCLMYLSTLIGSNTISISGYELPQSVRLIAMLLTGFMSFSGLRLFSKC
ncbi:MAG: hypothetical protein H8E70_04435 [Candidatus Marinimicrobia bacterium]|nr:hypothetical protein [Candidatus Neomarinimicrobiota bacterium]